MSNDRFKNTCFFMLLSVLIFSSCKHHEGEYHSVKDKIEGESKKYHGTSISSDRLLEEVKLLEVTEGEHTFLIPERKGEIRSFACIECHTGPLSEMQKESNGKKAHWDIKLKHAGETIMNCATCHNGNDMNNLVSLTGTSVDFNISYKVCAQCHTPQFEDWKGGAHGKKVAGWAPPRASMSCVNCHDPHSPSFETRWPAQFNTKIEEERKEGLAH